MRIGIAIEETWDFLHEIADDLSANHQTSLFKRRTVNLPIFHTRVNRWLYHRDLHKFMKSCDVAFFEWSSHLLETATAVLPKECGIVTRLHRYEMYQWVDRINWDAVDKIILVSQSKKQEFLFRCPDQAAKIVVINEAVDPSKYQFKSKKFSGDIGILCHLTPRKRVYELILAFYDLIQQRSDLHLHIGGGPHVAYGDYHYALQDLVRSLNLQDKVTFYGRVKDAWNWYQNVDIFISNAYSEGLQVAPIEAMACGTYCLIHHWGGAEELLPDPYLYYTDRQLQQKILAYCDLTETEQEIQCQTMRSIVEDRLNIHKTKVQVRNVIESAASSGLSSSQSRTPTSTQLGTQSHST